MQPSGATQPLRGPAVTCALNLRCYGHVVDVAVRDILDEFHPGAYAMLRISRDG